MTKSIEVFDPAQCCATGVCGPNVNAALPRFAADLGWLSARGVAVERSNLAQQPGAFAEREIVRTTLAAKGEACLPLVLAGGEIVSEGRYPSRAELAGWAAVEQPTSVYTPAVDELVAIGAAIASNCEPCLEFHVGRARELGVADEDLAHAVATARTVKETPARQLLVAADKLLGTTTARRGTSELSLPVVQVAGSGKCC
jgi:AhpD family alkylhydroperoxidase